MAKCEFCLKNFSNLSNLYRHAKTVHKSVKTREELLPVKCKEPGCNYGCRVMEKLIEHLCEFHKLEMEYLMFEFTTINEYKDWKARLEKHTHSFYIQISGTKRSKDVKRTYFYCNRTGNFKTKGTGQRKLKESIKIGGHCTSHFILTEAGDKLTAKFCKTHYGHTCGIQHVRLLKKERKAIYYQLNQGASISNILDKVRSSLSDEFQQQRDLTKSLLGKLESTVFNMFSLNYEDSEEALALASWVEHVKNLGEYNPVKFFKPRGMEDHKLKLDIDDFCLLVTTKFQEEVLKNIKSNLLCIDKITEVNNAKLGLSSILATDNEGRAIPVSFLISSKQDQKMFQVFFQVLKNVVGNIEARSIMTDDSQSVFSTWESIMLSSKSNHITSPWRVDRQWRENLGQLSTPFDQAAVYKTIKALHLEICIERFNLLLAECLNLFSDDPATEDFGKYFKHFYSLDPRSWAYCFHRIDKGNLFSNLEATRNALQYIFNKGRETKQIENSMVALLKMFRNNHFELMVEIMEREGFLSEGKILERHQECLKLDSEITQLTSTTWTVASEFVSGCFYTIELVSEICSCPFHCPVCSICVHTYQCSCPESLNKLGLCKHIHYLVEKIKQTTSIHIETVEDDEVETEQTEREIPDEGNTTCSQTMLDIQAQMDTLENLEQKRTEALNEINNLIKAIQNSNNMENINTALKEVKSILSQATDVDNHKPPSPAIPIITLEDDHPVSTDKNEPNLRREYLPEIIDITLSNVEAPLNENNQGIVTCPLAAENVLETAIALGSIREELDETSGIMIIHGEELELPGLGKSEIVITSEQQTNQDDSQESVMLWLQSDSEIIEIL